MITDGDGLRYGLPERTYVEDVLVFAFRDPEAARVAAQSLTGDAPQAGVMATLGEYVQRNRDRGASIHILHPELARGIITGDGFQVAVPDFSSSMSALSAIHVLRLASVDDAMNLKNALVHDGDVLAYANHPGIRAALDARPSGSCTQVDHQWSLTKCNFRTVWRILDPTPSPLVIGIIDDGGDEQHPELGRRITRYVPPKIGTPSDAPHAGAVAGILAAVRDGDDFEKMKGCCSPELHLYNVWAKDAGGPKFDYQAYYDALLAVAKHRLPVLNLSLHLSSYDDAEKSHILACIDQDVVVTAAMGSLGTGDLIYPAAYGGRIIAVGGTDPNDDPAKSTNTGSHMFIAAPGECILTTFGRTGYRELSGTSYATPLVTAAVWLARRRKSLTVDDVRALLIDSVAPQTRPNGGRSSMIGHGRLDMLQLLAHL